MRIGIAFPVIVFIVAVVFLAWFILSGYANQDLNLSEEFHLTDGAGMHSDWAGWCVYVSYKR